MRLMRLRGGGVSCATEVVLFIELGENEVFTLQLSRLYFDISK
jgi:hypothetical protein